MKFNYVDPALSRLAPRDKGLGATQFLGRFDLGKALLDPRLTEEASHAAMDGCMN
jgi:hypothetical protein